MRLPGAVRRFVPTGLRLRWGRRLSSLGVLVRSPAQVVGARLARGAPSVSYGHPRLAGPSEVSHGGLVKLQGLQSAYPHAPTRFNLLYLVSSNLPAAALPLTWLARARGTKLVWNQDGVAYPAWHGPGWEEANVPMRWLLRAADHVFYQSAFCKQAADHFLGEPRGQWEILYNPVDTRVFSPAARDPDPRKLVLLLGGNQDQHYRLAAALRALRALVDGGIDTRLLVTGRLGWERDPREAARAAARLITELGLERRVELIGPYTQLQAPSVFQRAHILLHTKYNDPCPGVVIEALACGLPVVHSATGGVPELVGSEAGIGIPAELSWESDLPPDPRSLADAVNVVVAERSRFSEAARRRAVDRFDVRPWIERHRLVFERLVR